MKQQTNTPMDRMFGSIMIVAHTEASAMLHKDCPKIVGLQSLLSHFDYFVAFA